MTGWRGIALKLASGVEALIDRLRARRRSRSGLPVLKPYRGLASAEGAMVRGRVLAQLKSRTPVPGQSRLRNALHMVDLFLTSEVPGVAVVVPDTGFRVVSDAEGYIELPLEGVETEAGWSVIPVEVEGRPESRVEFPVFRTRSDAALGVISDIDDTVLETGTHSLMRNLWTTLSGSALTRRVFPDAVVLIDHLAGHGRNPVYYVSSSPWNMHPLLETVFDKAALEAGPLFLRDYGLGPGQLIAGRHDDHKAAAIDLILSANPGLPFVLIGDTGQRDAAIYLDACRRHGGRIMAVVLRETEHQADDVTRQNMAQMRAMGAVVACGPTLDEAVAVLDRGGVGPAGRRPA